MNNLSIISAISQTGRDLRRVLVNPLLLFKVSLYRNAIYLFLNTVFNAAFGFAFWLISTRFYPPEVVGQASAIVSAMLLLSLAGGLGLGQGLVRYLAGSGSNAKHLINTIITLNILASTVIALIFSICIPLILTSLITFYKNPLNVSLFIIFTASSSLMSLLSYLYVARLKAVFSMLQVLAFGILKILLLVASIGTMTALGIVGPYGAAFTLSLVISIIIFIPRVERLYIFVPTIDWSCMKMLLNFVFANYAVQLLWIAPAYILPLIVLDRLGGEQNAYFYIAWTIANFVYQVGVSISTSLFAEGSYDIDALDINIKKSIKFNILLLIPSATLFLIFGDKFLTVFGIPYVTNANSLLTILVCAAVPVTFNWIYFGTQMVKKHMHRVMLANAFTTGVTLIASYYMVPFFGIICAGVAWLASQTVVAIVIAVTWISNTKEATNSGIKSEKFQNRRCGSI